MHKKFLRTLVFFVGLSLVSLSPTPSEGMNDDRARKMVPVVKRWQNCPECGLTSWCVYEEKCKKCVDDPRFSDYNPNYESHSDWIERKYGGPAYDPNASSRSGSSAPSTLTRSQSDYQAMKDRIEASEH